MPEFSGYLSCGSIALEHQKIPDGARKFSHISERFPGYSLTIQSISSG
jgi:hypothetical protein